MILVLFAQLRCRPPAGAKIVSGRQGRHLPTAITQGQQAVTACFARIRLALPGQRLYHTLTLTTQTTNGLPQIEIMIIRSPDATERFIQTHVTQGHQGLQISGEAGSRACPTEHRTGIVVTTALSNGTALARDEGREYNASVVVVAAQCAEVEIQRQFGI